MDKIRAYLNKDVKEFNVKLLVISGILFLFIVGLLSYKITINSSYALFVDTVNSTKTLTFHYEPSRVVTFDPDGGTIPEGNFWTGSGNSATKEVTTGLVYGDLPIPTKEGYTFKGWNGKNLLDLSKCTFSCARLNSDNSITANQNPCYYASIFAGYLKDYMLNNKGKTLSYSMNEKIDNKMFAIVIYGSRTSGATYQEVNINNTNKLSITIANDFTSVSNVELRFNRQASQFTDTTTIRKDFQLEESSTATEYEPYYITEDTKVVQDSNHTLKAIWEPINS